VDPLQVQVTLNKGVQGVVGDVMDPHKSDPLELWQLVGQLHDTQICELGAVRQVQVPDPCTVVNQMPHTPVGDIAHVSQMQILQVLPQP
jgi:hypothetical protein